MADTKVLEAFAVRCAGSSPVPGTKQIFRAPLRFGDRMPQLKWRVDPAINYTDYRGMLTMHGSEVKNRRLVETTAYLEVVLTPATRN